MKGYIDITELPLNKVLQDNHAIIAAECDNLFELATMNQKPKSVSQGQYGKNVDEVGKPMIEGDVRSLYLLLKPELLDDNEKEIVYDPKLTGARAWRRRMCPKTMALIWPFFPILGNVGFNRMFPGSVINPHFGVSTAYFRMHLGIRTDPDAKFYIKDEPSYTWTDGGTMAFTDGDVLHWVEHKGTKVRTIMSIDILKSALNGL